MQLYYNRQNFQINNIAKYKDYSEDKEAKLRSKALEYLASENKKDNFQVSSLLNKLDTSSEYSSFATQLKQKKDFEAITEKVKKSPLKSTNNSKEQLPTLFNYSKNLTTPTLSSSNLSLITSSVRDFKTNLTQVNREKYINIYQENSPFKALHFAS